MCGCVPVVYCVAAVSVFNHPLEILIDVSWFNITIPIYYVVIIHHNMFVFPVSSRYKMSPIRQP